MTRFRHLAVLGILAVIAVAAAPPPAAASPPTFAVQPIADAELNTAGPVVAIQADFVVTLAPLGAVMTIENIADTVKMTNTAMPGAAEQSSMLSAAARQPPNANYLTKTDMARSGKTTNMTKRHRPDAGILGARSSRLLI